MASTAKPMVWPSWTARSGRCAAIRQCSAGRPVGDFAKQAAWPVLRRWASQVSFEMRRFTIMHSAFYSNAKKRARKKTGAQACVPGFLTVRPDYHRPVHGTRMMTAARSAPAGRHTNPGLLILLGFCGETRRGTGQRCKLRAPVDRHVHQPEVIRATPAFRAEA